MSLVTVLLLVANLLAVRLFVAPSIGIFLIAVFLAILAQRMDERKDQIVLQEGPPHVRGIPTFSVFKGIAMVALFFLLSVGYAAIITEIISGNKELATVNLIIFASIALIYLTVAKLSEGEWGIDWVENFLIRLYRKSTRKKVA